MPRNLHIRPTADGVFGPQEQRELLEDLRLQMTLRPPAQDLVGALEMLAMGCLGTGEVTLGCCLVFLAALRGDDRHDQALGKLLEIIAQAAADQNQPAAPSTPRAPTSPEKRSHLAVPELDPD